MYPVLFELGSLRLYSWGFMLAIAVLIAIWGIGRLFEREDYSKDAVFEMVILMVIRINRLSSSLHYGLSVGGIPGRPTNVFFPSKTDRRDDMVRALIGVWIPVIYLHRKRMSFWKVADMFAPFLALGYALVRVGCF